MWDPGDWAPESSWGDPVALAHGLGLVELPEKRGEERLAGAYPWLPDSIQASAAASARPFKPCFTGN